MVCPHLLFSFSYAVSSPPHHGRIACLKKPVHPFAHPPQVDAQEKVHGDRNQMTVALIQIEGGDEIGNVVMTEVRRSLEIF